MNKQYKWLRRLIYVVPFIIGYFGLTAKGDTVLDALFNSIQMYLLNYGDAPANGLIEIARWTAPLATASGILMLLSAVYGRIGAAFKYRFTDSVAVYGPESEKKAMLRQLGARGIDGSSTFIPARRYMLLDSQTENFAFFTSHEQELKRSEIYLRCDTLPGQSVSAPNLHLFQPAEIAARLYWKQAGLYPVSCAAKHHLTIALIGCGLLGDHLLYWGLQNNIFDPDGRIRYQVFGSGEAFPAMYPQLEKISDPVEFFTDGWEDHLPMLETADRILVLPSDEAAMSQETVVSRLLTLLPGKPMTVLTEIPEIIRMLDGQDRLHIFDINSETLSATRIMDDDLLDLAKRINLRYAHLYNNVPETKENADKEWAKLDAFTRYSNISSADYHGIRLQMVTAMKAENGDAGLTGTQLELLAELEHIRWCRYHWLNNWRYGVPENGKAKDQTRQIHVDLIPYRELADPEKQKDRDTVGLMLEL